MKKILVIDDDPSILHAYAKMLRRLRQECLTADNAQSGLALVETERENKKPFDIVLTDTDMVGMTGQEVVDYLAKFHHQIYVVRMSGGGCGTDLQFQPDQFVEKPVSMDTFLQIVDSAEEKNHRPS